MVKYKQHRSTEMSVRTVVPQGSILEPLLFLIYINDIENCSTILSFVLYADDTNAFYSNSCLKTLASTIQNEMNEVVQWLNANKWSINASKTKFVIFKSKNKSQHQEIIVKINNDIVEQVPCVKFLGVLLIDQELTWKNHISSVLKNIIKSAGLIAKLRHFTNKNTSKLIYYALVYPYLTYGYGNLVWGNTYPTKLQKLLNVRKKIVRLICFNLIWIILNQYFYNIKLMIIYAAYSCIASIIVKICRNFIMIYI
jgi:hypothetical protein